MALHLFALIFNTSINGANRKKNSAIFWGQYALPVGNPFKNTVYVYTT